MSSRAAGTSEPGALKFGANGRGHILSPFGVETTGRARVTALADTAAEADGPSTALCAAGPGRAATNMARRAGVRMIADFAHGARMALG
jgi:thiamine biosynthesis lipoprotein ApbE